MFCSPKINKLHDIFLEDFRIWISLKVFPPIFLRRSSIFPFEELDPSINSTHQHHLLCDCYQNNDTAEKEALNDVI